MTQLNIAQSNPGAPVSALGKTKAQYRAAIQARRTHVCLGCNKEYVSKRRHSTEGHKYCSRECAFATRASNAKPIYSPVRFNTCIVCSSKWVTRRKTVSWCSDRCGREVANRKSKKHARVKHQATIKKRQCKECLIPFVPVYGNKNRLYCSDICGARHARRNGKAARKARCKDIETELFDVVDIFKRDKWRCKSCGIKTPWAHRGTIKPTAPQLDHIIPISKGGKHIKTNVQLMCRSCNGSKSNGHANDQLLMFG